MPRRDTRIAVIAAALALVVLIVGIGLLLRLIAPSAAEPAGGKVRLLTELPPQFELAAPLCEASTTGGHLVPHPRWGLALQGQGPPLMTIWPRDYVGRVAGDRIELLDGAGRVLARTGDQVAVTGKSLGTGNVFVVCPGSVFVMPTQ